MNRAGEQAVVRAARAGLRWRSLILTLAVAACAAVASGAAFLTFDIDYRVYFSADNPELRQFEALQDVYAKQDNVLFVLAPEDGDALSPRMLAVVERLTEKAWHIPYARRVDSVTNFQHSYAEGEELVIEELVTGPLERPPEAIARVREVALSEPLLVNRLVSPTGHVTAVNVTLQLPSENLAREVPEVVAHARKLAREVERENPSIRVHLTGIAMLNNAFPEATLRDLRTLIPLAYAVLVVALVVVLRSLVAAAVTLVIVAMSSATAMGFAGWAGIALTPPSAAAATIVMTLAVADSIHILMTFLGQRRQGAGQREALIESLRINAQPVFLTTATTAVGLASMNFSDSPPFRDLGNIAAVGALAAFVYAVTVLPALVTMLPVRSRAPRRLTHRLMQGLATVVIGRRNVVLATTAVVIAGLVAFVPRNELGDDFVDYFDETTTFRQASDFAADNLTGPYTIQYSLAAGGPGGINEPAYLATLERFANWYRRQPGVRHVSAVTDLLKRLNRNMHGDDVAYYRLPETRELASQFFLLYELSLPLGLDLTDQINIDKSATRVAVNVDRMSTGEIKELDDRAQTWLAANALPSMAAAGTGTIMMFAHISEHNIRSMLGGTALAVAVIALCLAAALRSPKLGLISLMPNAFPALLGFGAWGLVVGQVGLAASVVAVMTLGIVVDDTVHFLSKYLRARRERGLDPAGAVRYAYQTVGAALAATSFVLVAGFLVLAQSTFRMNWELGWLCAITIAFALAADFLFLPALLMKLERGREGAQSARPHSLEAETEA